MRPGLPSILASLVAIALVTGATTWSLRRIEEQRREGLRASLTTVLETTQGGLHVWLDGVEADVSSITGLERVRELAETQLQVARTPEALRASPALGELRRLMEWPISTHGYVDFVLAAPDGTLVAASDDALVGTRMTMLAGPHARALEAALGGALGVAQPTRSAEGTTSPLMGVAAPVRRSDGTVMAALLVRLDPSRGLSRMMQLGRIGETGETYAFDSNGLMVTESRFQQQLPELGLLAPGESAILNLEVRDPTSPGRPLTLAAREALSRNTGINLDGYRDYRGERVVGAWTWSPELGLGLATEMDRKEAYRVLRHTQRLVLFVLAVAMVTGTMAMGVLGRHARRLAASVAREKEAVRTRDELIAVVSHDLRGPLMVILLDATHLLKQQLAAGEAMTPLRRKLERIRTSVDRMVHLVDQLLSASQLEAGQLPLNPRRHPPLGLVERAMEMFTPLANQKELRLSREVPGPLPDVLADNERLLQVLSNLLGNAIKFTPAGGSVTLRAEQVDREVRFSVIDTGPGIQPEDLAHAFERYWQGRQVGGRGVGLGLYISKRLVEAQGGRIRIESRPGGGTIVSFTIPVAG